MIAMQCATCGEGITVDETQGSGQPCPVCGQSVGKLPIQERAGSTALDDLQGGVAPVRFGAYSKAADAAWDDPMEPRVEEQVAHLVADEAIIDNAIINAVPPEIEARFRAHQREVRKKAIALGVVAVVALLALLAFLVY